MFTNVQNSCVGGEVAFAYSYHFYSYLSKLQIKILSQVLDMVSVIACKVAIQGIIPGLQ